jgi:dipeptidyl aminopeptidase/acylaminoacyl peptidase
MMTNRIIYIPILIAILGGTVLAGYFWWYLPSQEPVAVIAEKALTKISSENAVSPVNSYDNNALWYGLENGRLMRYDLNTGSQSEYPLQEILGKSFKKIYWPRQGSDFIAQSALDGLAQFSYYNFGQKRYDILPPNVVALDWFPDGLKIAVIWKSGDGKTYLVTSNPDASGYKIISELPWPNMTLKTSPSNATALLIRPPAGDVNKIYLFDLETGQYTEEVTEGRNTAVIWSSQGDRFAFTRLIDNKSRVFVHDLLNGKDTDMNIDALADKIAFSADGNRLYVARPTEGGNADEVLEIHLVNETRKVVFTSDTLRIRNMIIIGEKLFFLDQSGALYGYQ